jgi:hypothetical protein
MRHSGKGTSPGTETMQECPVFSGAEVLLRFQCGTKTRVIRSNILDRDWFDPSAKTPRRTLWTANLLDRLEQAVGPGVIA